MRLRKISVFILIIMVSSFFVQISPVVSEENQMERPQINNKSELFTEYYNNTPGSEEYYQSVYSELKVVSTSQVLEINELSTYKTETSSILFDTVEYWLLNFSYINEYSTTAHQEDSNGLVRYNVNETIVFRTYAYFPVILATYRNSSTSAGDTNYIVTESIIDTNYPAKIGFEVNLDIEFFFKGSIIGMECCKVGPGKVTIPIFKQNWDFLTPLDGKESLDKSPKFQVPLPPPFSFIFVGLSLEPKIDADFSALITSNNSLLRLSSEFLSWEKNNDLQSFSYSIPEFYDNNFAIIDLFNFDMKFVLNIVLNLEITLNIPFFSLPFTFPIFSFPIAETHLPLDGNINLATTVTTSDKIPVVYGVAYDFSDSQGNDNKIIESGETIDLLLAISNLGEGSGLDINTTLQSDNITVSGTSYTPLLLRNSEEIKLVEGLSFIVPSNYPSRHLYINATFSYQALNGSVYSNTYVMFFRVVQPIDTYLEVSNIFIDTPYNYWVSGENISLSFNVTNKGGDNIENAQLIFSDGFDTDPVNPITITESQTNVVNLTVGQSATIGNINFTSTPSHEDGLLYLYFYVYYENATHIFVDYLYFALPISVPKPDLNLISAIGYDDNLDGLFQAGEEVQIEFVLENIGIGEARNIRGKISSDNPDLNITNSNVVLDSLNPSTSGSSTNASITIPLTAINNTGIFTLKLFYEDIQGNQLNEEFNISISIIELPSPELSLLSYVIDDSVFGNNNGLADPGEMILLKVNINVANTGFNVLGEVNTSSTLLLLNSSANYGDLTDQFSSGDGFVIQVPLDYQGGISRIDVTIFAESYSGRKINSSAYIDLDIAPGDLSAPEIDFDVTKVPNTLVLGNSKIIEFNVTDPLISNELLSGLEYVYVLWALNNGELQLTELIYDINSYKFNITATELGFIEFILVGIDFAGNIGYIADGTETFKINFISRPSTTTPTSLTSTLSTSSKDTIPTTSNPVSTAYLSIWIIFVSIAFLGVFKIIRKKNR